MNTMVVQNKAYDVALWIFPVKFLQELYKAGAFVAVSYQRNCIPGQQVYPCKEGHCPEPLVFAVPLYETFSLLRRQVGGNRCDGLYAGFFVIRDCMYFGGFFILYYELPIFSSSILARCIIRASIVGVLIIDSSSFLSLSFSSSASAFGINDLPVWHIMAHKFLLG